ncbi:hypothetical protein P4S72_18010 [Vibrio sp. PP-XX7]
MPKRSLREKLQGVWLLERFIDVLDDGKIVHTLGEGATGYISYSADGWVSGPDDECWPRVVSIIRISSAGRKHSLRKLQPLILLMLVHTKPMMRSKRRHTIWIIALIPEWVDRPNGCGMLNLANNDALLTLSSGPVRCFDGVIHNPTLRWRRRVAWILKRQMLSCKEEKNDVFKRCLYCCCKSGRQLVLCRPDFLMCLPPYWGGTALNAVIQESGIDAEQIDEVIMGCVLTAGVGQAPARQAMMLADIHIYGGNDGE